ncbi:hypothetical protein BBK14_20455 [Parafrankia soli]|uniref:Uncharacterized protein n=1 Tax=Parafrankia soli TaxID=2599596 RepID=A0A1S1PXT1_9ACTN|nr:hypothetical protein [Parafrankia soli]OHV27488.1 hypothetical protein BBK14_20455 [Parafrankia soli]
MDRPWDEDALCVVCPALVHDRGRFDIADGPGPDSRYDTSRGYRRDSDTGVPVCVHPHKIGVASGRYASAGQRWPEEADRGPAPGPMPDQAEGLAEWMTALVRHTGPGQVDVVLAQAERAAAGRFPAAVIVDALRVALAAAG